MSGAQSDLPSEVMLKRRGAAAWITLNRPDRLNAINQSMLDGLALALDRIDADPPQVRAIVLTGAGRAFCAGGDLADFMAAMEAGDAANLTMRMRRAMDLMIRLEEHPLPVVAAVNGAAVAGGSELVLCCDLAIASRSAKMGDGHLTYGALPGGGGSVRLCRKVASNVASQLLLTGRLYAAETFVQWGLVNEVVDPDALDATVADLVGRIAATSAHGSRFMKQFGRQATALDKPAALCAEVEFFGAYAYSADFREGCAAFLERRRPRYE